jgi:hypothetical protein
MEGQSRRGNGSRNAGRCTDRPPDPQATLSKQPTNKLVDDEGMDRDPADSRCLLGRSASFKGVRSTARSHLTMQTSIADDGGCGTRGVFSLRTYILKCLSIDFLN